VVAVDEPSLNQFQGIDARLIVSHSVDAYCFDYAGVKVFFCVFHELWSHEFTSSISFGHNIYNLCSNSYLKLT
jgi:hypothetical protein